MQHGSGHITVDAVGSHNEIWAHWDTRLVEGSENCLASFDDVMVKQMFIHIVDVLLVVWAAAGYTRYLSTLVVAVGPSLPREVRLGRYLEKGLDGLS